MYEEVIVNRALGQLVHANSVTLTCNVGRRKDILLITRQTQLQIIRKKDKIEKADINITVMDEIRLFDAISKIYHRNSR